MTYQVMVRMDDNDERLFHKLKLDWKRRGLKIANGELFLMLLREHYPQEVQSEEK
jgi:adenosine/AMP kinase